MFRKKISIGIVGITFVSLVILFGVLCISPSTYAAVDAQQEACSSIGGTIDKGVCVTGGTSINSVIKALVNLISIFVGVLSVIMLMVGGFKYTTSSGDSGKVSSAKNTIIYSIVGLLIALFAQSIVWFVLEQTA